VKDNSLTIWADNKHFIGYIKPNICGQGELFDEDEKSWAEVGSLIAQ